MFATEKILPLGQSDFQALRESNAVYVDKSDLIYEIARMPGSVFLARPRRFGKSLLVSAFESLFKYGVRDFKGLAIENLWTDKTYNVIRLDFSNIKDFSGIDDFAEQFRYTVCSKFSELGFHPNDTSNCFTDLGNWIGKLPKLSLVLLIDEYDAPLTACMDNPELFVKVRAEMRKLFSPLKTNVGSLRFLFLTGITKFSSTSIFSELNNLDDVTLSPKFGTLLGYTEEEIRTQFAPYLSRAAKATGMTEDALMDNLRTYYNGFCFDMHASTRVYCPWSVLKFLKAPEQGFINYWFSSGGHPTVLMKYLNGHELEQPTSYAETKQVRLQDLNDPKDLPSIKCDILLAQTGYLTIKSVDGLGLVTLGFPNREVAVSMARLYADELLAGRVYRPADGVMLETLLAKDDLSAIVERFNEVLNALDYNRYPIVDEATCRAYLQVLLIGADMVPRVEVHTSQGRSDLEVDAGSRHWVFELKFAATKAQASQLLAEAVTQMHSRRYGRTPHGRKLMRAAMVFSAEDRRFIVWQEVGNDR